MSALDKQVGGSHYKDYKIQPIEFITENNIPYCEANAIKYICRHASKNGKQDLEKARHYIDILIEKCYNENPPERKNQQDWLDGMEHRIDIIGQNGGDGEHYPPVFNEGDKVRLIGNRYNILHTVVNVEGTWATVKSPAGAEYKYSVYEIQKVVDGNTN